MPATDPNELFEIFDRTGKRTGTAPRGRVHTEGLWHRSAHVFLYDEDDRLLIQQRSASKDLYAGAWDYSVGEHLQPGEEYLQAAHRGLTEELAVTVDALDPLGAPTPSEFIADAGSAIDREFQQAYRGRLPAGADPELKFDPTEVAQVQWLTAAQLRQRIAHSGEHFTPWFLRDVERFGLAQP